MWIEVNEIVEWDRSTSEAKPVTKPAYIDSNQIIMMRRQHHGAEIYIKNTWLYVTDEVNDILKYIPER